MSNVVTRTLGREALRLVARHVRSAMVGGSSQVRSADRAVHLRRDQAVGLMVHYTANVELFGLEEGTRLFEQQRAECDANPTQGDGGRGDVPGYYIDHKGSFMAGSADPLAYHAPVRPRELHVHLAYVWGLVAADRRTVHLGGWMPGWNYPPPATEGVFKGAHVVPFSDLYPLYALDVSEYAWEC